MTNRLSKQKMEPLAISMKLVAAAGEGNLDECKRLVEIESAVASFHNSYALQNAAMNGHQDVVAYLIPLSEPQADDSLALKNASVGMHTKCATMLLPVSDTRSVIGQLLEDGFEDESDWLKSLAESFFLLEAKLPISSAKNMKQRGTA